MPVPIQDKVDEINRREEKKLEERKAINGGKVGGGCECKKTLGYIYI